MPRRKCSHDPTPARAACAHREFPEKVPITPRSPSPTVLAPAGGVRGVAPGPATRANAARRRSGALSQRGFQGVAPLGQQSSALPLPYPGHRWLGRFDRWLVLAVAPVTAWALFVMCGPAGRADHGAIIGGSAGRPQGLTSVAGRPKMPERPGAPRGELRRRWRGASGGAVRRPSPPHSGRPRCRTFLAGKRHK